MRSRSRTTRGIAFQKSVSASKYSLRSPGFQTRLTTPQRCQFGETHAHCSCRHLEALGEIWRCLRLSEEVDHCPDAAERL